MKERIILLIKAKNFTAAQFADEIGVQKSGISHIISGRNNPSLDFVQKILQRFPEVNMEWLVMGKGPMFSGDPIKSSTQGTALFTFQEEENHEPDLFSTERLPAFTTSQTIIPEETDKKPLAEVSEPARQDENSDRVEISKEETKIPAGITMKNKPGVKNIEKVLFFYSDKTFHEYYPEN